SAEQIEEQEQSLEPPAWAVALEEVATDVAEFHAAVDEIRSQVQDEDFKLNPPEFGRILFDRVKIDFLADMKRVDAYVDALNERQTQLGSQFENYSDMARRLKGSLAARANQHQSLVEKQIRLRRRLNSLGPNIFGERH